MARTPFKLRSGNSTPFKQIGSSPVKKTDWAAMQAKSAKKDPRYGKMTAEEYKTEALRQSKAKKETGSWDAMGAYDAKGKKKTVKKTTPKAKEKTFKPGGEGDVLTKNIKDTSQKGDEAVRRKKVTVENKPKKSIEKKTKKLDPLTRLSDRITRKSRSVKAAMDAGATKKEAKKMYKTVKKQTKKAKKLDKIQATADVRAARVKYGRGSAEVKAAKAKRRKIRKTRIEDY